MGLVRFMSSVAKGAITGVIMTTALPVLGVAGTITTVGKTVSSIAGGIAGAYDYSKKK